LFASHISQKNSTESVDNFPRYPANRQTNKGKNNTPSAEVTTALGAHNCQNSWSRKSLLWHNVENSYKNSYVL